ncbi:SPOR domain-containing protein [Comamonas terrigena]|uniref:SPOR domain-containing protein n=1 Tax=Comamonas terrigena TaxID=32013 RepID=UPI0024473323|nr:SPOR domain-containing protein [Comamonas terrigena]MDH1702789.1 SPOR domain-containing protein [Comamonas terrigena]
MSSEHNAPPVLSADNPLMPRLYQAAIGPLQTAYYQRQFERFDALGKPLPSWNWAAGCCTLGWMALRGLWRHAAVYAGVLVAVVALWWTLGLNQLLPRPAALALALLLVLLAVLLPGLGGNALYHRAVRERTMQALTRSRTLGEAMALLETQAPTPTRLQWATTGHALSALLVAGLVWGLSTLSTTTGPVHTGPTQQDTARALAALAPTPAADTPPAPPAAAETAPAAPDSPPASDPAAGNATPLSPLEQPGQTDAAAPGAPAAAVVPSALAASSVAAVTASAAPASAALPESAKPAPASAKADHGGPTTPNERARDKAGSKTDKAPGKVDKAAKADQADKPDSKHAAAGKTVLQPRKYYLNSGLYAHADNAQRVARRLREAGQPVFTQLLESRQGEVTRIRVGPFDSRAQAEAAASKIQGMKLEAQVFRHLPD